MKLQGLSSALPLVLVVLLLAVCGRCAAPVSTRASHLGAVAVGMGQILHMADYLRDYPGSRTAILAYFKIDSMEVGPLVKTLSTNAAEQERQAREFWPQIAIETDHLSLAAFHHELAQRGSVVEVRARTLAHAVASYRDLHKWYFIRPFSEMNDGTESTPWEFGNPRHSNTPADFAAAWTLLRKVFDEEGATNAIFVFSPLAAHGVHRESDVLAALDRIPVGSIDAFGLNLYSRPASAYGGASRDPIPFAELARGWMQVLARSKHRGIPLAVAEMAVSSQATDEKRAQWLREACRFARTHGFVLITYFNYPHRYWHIGQRTWAADVLGTEINR